jgi:YgiT-type zinc finger domain-containing protein
MDNKKEFDKYRELLKDAELGECQACGGPLMLEKVNLEDYQGGKLYMMEKVPAFVCQNCGEVWVPEPIMEEFEKMIETVKARKKKNTPKKAKKSPSTPPRKSRRRSGQRRK